MAKKKDTPDRLVTSGYSGLLSSVSHLLEKLSVDLTARFGRGFGKSNLFQMRGFYLSYPNIFQTLSGKSEADQKSQTPSGISVPLTIPQTLSAESDILHRPSEKSETPSEAC